MSRSFIIYSKTKRPQKLEYPKEIKDYVDYEIVQKVNKYGDGDQDFEIVEEVVEHKVNIDKFINSFKDIVGIDAILKQIAKTGDYTLVNQVEEIHADLSKIPEDPGEAFEMAKTVEQAFAEIDPELTGGLSMEDFVKGLTVEKLNDYIKKQVEKKLAEAKEKPSDESSK